VSVGRPLAASVSEIMIRRHIVAGVAYPPGEAGVPPAGGGATMAEQCELESRPRGRGDAPASAGDMHHGTM